MPALPPSLFDAVVAQILPFVQDEGERNAWLTPQLSQENVYARIKWTGPARSFAVHIVQLLSHDQLTTALRRLPVGNEQRDSIESLCERIEAHALAPVGGQPNPLLVAYHQRCRAQWQNEPYVVQDRFVELVLTPRDEDEIGGGAGRTTRRIACDDLRILLQQTREPTVLLLGAPGSGKSTLLRRLQWDVAGECLNDPNDSRITFFAALNRYQVSDDDPRQWLNARWREFAPELPPLDDLLQAGRVLLLLDGLNEMRCTGPADFEAKVAQWQEFIAGSAARGNRAVFTCRERDYVGRLDSDGAPLAIADVQPMSRELIRKFLDKYIATPAQAARAFEQIVRDDKLRELYGTPYFLSLLIPQIGPAGEIPATRARLFTGFVRHSLREELKRSTRLIAADAALLHERDKADLNAGTPDPYWLPKRGLLISRLSALAFAMQQRYRTGGSQVAFEVEEAAPILGERADDLIAAGRHIKMLDEVSGSGQIKFFHQLLQEYFAARELARQPERDPALAAAPWLAAEIETPYESWLAGDGQNPRARLPNLPTTGWEETARMTAEMVPDPEAFVRALMATNLPLAGECAAALGDRLSPAFCEALRWALVRRSQDPHTDLRARIAAGLALGPLGDPRLLRHRSRDGQRTVLTPPMVSVPGGIYIIGSDDHYDDEKPAHPVYIAPFEMSAFPVTNAEFKCFIDAGGYTTDEWWDTPSALAWRKGESDPQALIDDYLSRWRNETKYSEDEIRARWASDPDFADALLVAKAMSDEQLADVLRRQLGSGEAVTQPLLWDDPAYNNPAQPVVGVCWHEARAYCNWLSAQTGQHFRLPTEVEHEAAARGYSSFSGGGRTYAYEGDFDPTRANTLESRIRATTPVGIYPSAPDGLYDLTGNVWEWTSSAYLSYPYELTSEREDPGVEAKYRVVRGGSWYDDRDLARCAFRLRSLPDYRYDFIGFRVVRSSAPIP